MTKYPILYCPWLHVNGMAIFPFILISNKTLKQNNTLINHELIHIRQQIELLILPFYIFYLSNYLINLVIFRDHAKAYKNIIFEREAYSKDMDIAYLKYRKTWAFLNF